MGSQIVFRTSKWKEYFLRVSFFKWRNKLYKSQDLNFETFIIYEIYLLINFKFQEYCTVNFQLRENCLRQNLTKDQGIYFPENEKILNQKLFGPPCLSFTIYDVADFFRQFWKHKNTGNLSIRKDWNKLCVKNIHFFHKKRL